MKTKCYCIFCPKHPLFEKQKEYWNCGRIAGWHSNMPMPIGFNSEVGMDVDCLNPESDAFYDLGIDSEDCEFKITAYGDGLAETGFLGDGFGIDAYCANETYKEIK